MKYFGVDYIGGGNYPELIAENHRNGLSAGFLWNVDGFKRAEKAITLLTDAGKCPHIRIHLEWRDTHIFGMADIPKVKAKAEKVIALIDKLPKGIEWAISPLLEHKLPYNTALAFYKEIQPIIKGKAEYINSFISGGAILPQVVNETHHADSPMGSNYVFSYDGLTSLDSNVLKRVSDHSKANIFYFWDWSLNCKYEKEDPVKNRADRKLIPSAKVIQSLGAMSTAVKPKGIPSQHIYKAYAEGEPEAGQHGVPKARSWKPVLLLSGVDAPFVELKTKGVVVGTFKRDYNTTHKPELVYRSDEMGIDIYNRAMLFNRRGLCNVVVNGESIGQINPILRANQYKEIA